MKQETENLALKIELDRVNKAIDNLISFILEMGEMNNDTFTILSDVGSVLDDLQDKLNAAKELAETNINIADAEKFVSKELLTKNKLLEKLSGGAQNGLV